MQSIDSIETYVCGASKDLLCKKEKIKCDNIIKQYKNDTIQQYNTNNTTLIILQKKI